MKWEEYLMRKKLISKLTILAVTGTLCTSIFAPSLNTYAHERNFENVNSNYGWNNL